MSILSDMALALDTDGGSFLTGYRDEPAGELEEQLNNVIDRGLRLYLTYLAVTEGADLVGNVLGGPMDDDPILEDIGEGTLAGFGKSLADDIFLPKKLSPFQKLFG